MNLSYAAVETTPVHCLEYSESGTDNIDTISDEPSMITGFTNAYKLLGLENSIKSIELHRVYVNTAQSTIFGEMKQVIQAMLAQS
jgi:hypothetical protein